MTTIELIGVPFDGYGRPGNHAAAAGRLREVGFGRSTGRHEVIDRGDLALPAPDGERGGLTGMVNEQSLLGMTSLLNRRVAESVTAGRFPIVFGGDCSSLLGTVTGLRDALGGIGLLFIDGHEDTMPLDVSEDGEAANSEIGLLLGITGKLTAPTLRRRLPGLDREALAVLGPRDATWRRRFNVGSLRDYGVHLRDVHEVAADPAGAAREAVAHLVVGVERWWLHTDLDVLDPVEFAAQGLPDVDDEPGGLTWAQLAEVVVNAVEAGGCVGWSVAIYDPDQDPDGGDARRVVRLGAQVVSALP